MPAAATHPLRPSRPWWKDPPVDRRGIGILVTAYLGFTVVWTGLGELIVRWWDDSSFGDADTAVNRWIEGHRTDTLTELAHVGSALSDTGTKIVLVIGLLPVMLGLYRRWHDWALLALGLLLEVAVFGTSATIVGRPRPPVLQLDGAPTDSWPSGHIAASVVFYVGLSAVLVWNNHSRRTRIVAMCIAVGAPSAVTASRLYLGMHQPTDAVGGAVLGLCSLAVVRHTLRRTAGHALEHPVVTHGPLPEGETTVSAALVAGTEEEDAALVSTGGSDDGRTR